VARKVAGVMRSWGRIAIILMFILLRIPYLVAARVPGTQPYRVRKDQQRLDYLSEYGDAWRREKREKLAQLQQRPEFSEYVSGNKIGQRSQLMIRKWDVIGEVIRRAFVNALYYVATHPLVNKAYDRIPSRRKAKSKIGENDPFAFTGYFTGEQKWLIEIIRKKFLEQGQRGKFSDDKVDEAVGIVLINEDALSKDIAGIHLNFIEQIVMAEVVFVQTKESPEPNATIIDGIVYIFANSIDEVDVELLARILVHETVEEALRQKNADVDADWTHKQAEKVDQKLITATSYPKDQVYKFKADQMLNQIMGLKPDEEILVEMNDFIESGNMSEGIADLFEQWGRTDPIDQQGIIYRAIQLLRNIMEEKGTESYAGLHKQPDEPLGGTGVHPTREIEDRIDDLRPEQITEDQEIITEFHQIAKIADFILQGLVDRGRLAVDAFPPISAIKVIEVDDVFFGAYIRKEESGYVLYVERPWFNLATNSPLRILLHEKIEKALYELGQQDTHIHTVALLRNHLILEVYEVVRKAIEQNGKLSPEEQQEAMNDVIAIVDLLVGWSVSDINIAAAFSYYLLEREFVEDTDITLGTGQQQKDINEIKMHAHIH